MLFIESPGAVGFSTDTHPDIKYNDKQTADDCMVAIKDFLWNVAPEFTNRQIYVCIHLNIFRFLVRAMLANTSQILQ
jgi:hypothetical protein